ncbi:ABC transporter ATP-binding protein [Acuticoccus mangrovi]|uniref:ABC transporter ATP-binding protein n=1 Tax=Acuticoccus mangrovi TaxID=2796142 RepID=A0A934ILX7_9HYPH|nr:ABC transporter ATP-binding protein [Acuticoccus mangrovi]MBJ3774667.1 ABC transporter ATP-binding protein [Acuticoccus mangrovi]
MNRDTLLSTDRLTKTFGALTACDGISIRLGEGEIVALLGENGAGKSTLVKMLFGALQPDSGGIAWKGENVALTEPRLARRLGIGMVHQHFSLFEAFTVAENIALVLGEEKMSGLAARARTLSEDYGLPLDPGALVADLSVGERQRIEIVRCLLQNPTLVIMDEPTSVLTPQEADRLFVTLRKLKAEGRTVLYISHKLEEVRALCDRAVVMRAGRVVAEVDPKAETAASLAAAMVGGEVPAVSQRAAPAADAPVALAINHLDHPSDRPFGVSLADVSLTVLAGEVVGIAGMAGNGQGELFECLSGEVALRGDAGEVSILGTVAAPLGVDARRRLGAAFVPEERLGHATAPSLDLTDNIILARHQRRDRTVGPLGLLHKGAARRAMRRIVEAMDVRGAADDPPARALSGGNLQKYVVGRELDWSPRLLVINQPTWGVDAGAAANIRQAILDLAASGAGVLVISQDLDELFLLADRIAVISEGRLSTPAPVASLTREAVGLLMGGAEGHHHAA